MDTLLEPSNMPYLVGCVPAFLLSRKELWRARRGFTKQHSKDVAAKKQFSSAILSGLVIKSPLTSEGPLVGLSLAGTEST